MTLCDKFTEPKHNLNQTVKFEPNLENRVRGFPVELPISGGDEDIPARVDKRPRSGPGPVA